MTTQTLTFSSTGALLLVFVLVVWRARRRVECHSKSGDQEARPAP